jgi:ACS family tartrate transporter-like MFS transporter
VLANGSVASSRESSYRCIVVFTLLLVFGCVGVGLLRPPLLVICSLALIPMCHNANFGPVYAIAASFLEKKAAAGGIALVNTIGIVGGFLGPYYIGLAKDFTGSYQRGFLTLSLPCLVALSLILYLGRSTASDPKWVSLGSAMPVLAVPAASQSETLP